MQKVSLNDVIHRLENIFNRTIEVEYLEERKGDVKHSLASVKKLQDIYGYKVQKSLDQGLTELVNE